MVNQQNTCNLINFVSEKSNLLSEKSYLFLPFYVLSFPLADYYERFNFFFVNFTCHRLFPTFSLKFLRGKLVRLTKNVPICACPAFGHPGHPGNHKIPISSGGEVVM